MSNGTRAAAEPFQFFTVDGIARTEDRKANTVRELLHGLETCSDDSIYHHMIQVPSSEEFVNGNASNDFAKWVRAMPECGGLSEQLAALDERYYSSIEEMRNDLRGWWANTSRCTRNARTRWHEYHSISARAWNLAWCRWN